MLAKYVARRFLASVVVVLGVTLITLVLMDRTRGTYVPGIDLNPSLRPEDIARLRADLGLDRPFYLWYITWIWGVLHGDFGRSMIDGSTVMSHILDRLPNTLELTGTAILIGVLISIPVGVIGALRHGTKTDHTMTVVSVAGFAVPQFWMGLILILIFSVTLEQHGLPRLPSTGAVSHDRPESCRRAGHARCGDRRCIDPPGAELLERVVGAPACQSHRHHGGGADRGFRIDRGPGARLLGSLDALRAADDRPEQDVQPAWLGAPARQRRAG